MGWMAVSACKGSHRHGGTAGGHADQACFPLAHVGARPLSESDGNAIAPVAVRIAKRSREYFVAHFEMPIIACT
jgi:hypothetical protein